MAVVQTVKIDRICRRFFSKCLGLMFSRKQNIVLEFSKEQMIGLHMFFVFYPIDIVFLNKKKKIVEIKRNLKPFRFYKSRKKAKYAVEIQKGKLNKSTTNLKLVLGGRGITWLE